jgi:choline dehydrogenase
MEQQQEQALPRAADTVIVGGGSAGAVIAGRLAERSDRSVLLLEAGPDYGPYEGGGWPWALLDARVMPVSLHDWGYVSAARYGVKDLALERARVIGGCSSHNGCAAVWGHRADYDGWERLGNPGWGTESLLPLFRAANERMRVSTPARHEVTPFHQASLDAAPGAGIPVVPELNTLELELGIAIGPANIWQGIRWNAAFAYLDPVRHKSTLAIRGHVLVDRLLLQGSRVVGLEVIGPDGPARIEAGQVVVAGGTYGSPLLLLRSGIGDPERLRAAGVTPRHALPGVGENLHDHPIIQVIFTGTEELIREMEAWEAAGGLMREEGTIAKARSSFCTTAHDLQLYPLDSRAPGSWSADRHLSAAGQWIFGIPASNMTPRSRGFLRLSSPHPDAPPVIDHAYLTDEDDRDVNVLLDGIELARSIAAQPPLAGRIAREVAPGPHLTDRGELADYVRSHSTHDYHPVGTCKMGPASDPLAVVDARGRVHGLEGLYVADASIMPVVPRANTNIPAVVVGEKIAALLLAEEYGG